MRLDEILDTVTGSTPDEWAKVNRWGTTFLHEFGSVGFPGGESQLTTDWHSERWVYRPYAAIGLASGMRSHGDRELSFPWATFPDPAVRGFWADVLYHGQLVHREQLLSVDGGRATFPTPDVISVENEKATLGREYVGEEITDTEWRFACLVHRLEGGPDEQDSYLRRAGLVLVQGWFRW